VPSARRALRRSVACTRRWCGLSKTSAEGTRRVGCYFRRTPCAVRPASPRFGRRASTPEEVAQRPIDACPGYNPVGVGGARCPPTQGALRDPGLCCLTPSAYGRGTQTGKHVPRANGAFRAPYGHSLLDAVTSGVAVVLPRVRGTTPFRYRERTCARAPGVVRWGSMVNALGFQRTCYGVIGHLRARHVLGKTPFLDEVTRATPGHESTWRFWPDQEKPSNNCFRRNTFRGIGLGLVVGGIVGHLDGLFPGLSGTRCAA